jgi:hypothetical protein
MGFALNLSCLSATSSGPIKVLSASHLSAPFIGLSIGLNFTATALITFRLMGHRTRLVQAGLKRADARAYTSLLGIIVESALLYTVAGVVFIPFLVKRMPVATAFSTCFIVTAFLAPGLIQLRIARGTAYGRSGPQSGPGQGQGHGQGQHNVGHDQEDSGETATSFALDTHMYASRADVERGTESWRPTETHRNESARHDVELWGVKS